MAAAGLVSLSASSGLALTPWWLYQLRKKRRVKVCDRDLVADEVFYIRQ
jgi:hypothetical protein